jgi:Na+/H+-dicarboxylate symporter
LGTVLPIAESGELAGILERLQLLALRAGRYAAAPLVVFSLTIALYELRREGQLLALIGKTLLVILVTSVVVLGAGIGLCRLFPVGRIPVFAENAGGSLAIPLGETALELLPANMLAVLVSDSPFLFPLCIFAFVMAVGLSAADAATVSKPVLSAFDALSRVFFHVAAFISEILGFALIVLAAAFAFRYREMLKTNVFETIVVPLLAVTLFLSFIVLPALLYLLKPRSRRSPWSKVYGALASAIAAFFSGDIHFTLPILTYLNRENLGVRRRVNAVSTMLFTTIGRSGSAMIAAASFIVILKSYSSIEITFAQTVQIGIRALFLSFVLGRNSADGAFAALAVLCLWAPKGFETGYLILRPVSFFLISCGALIDAMAASLGSYAVSRLSPSAPVENSA